MNIMNNLEKLVDGVFKCNSCEIISMFLLLIIVILLYNMFSCCTTNKEYKYLNSGGACGEKEPRTHLGGGEKDEDHAHLGNGNNTLIFYYVDWCGHCRKFKETWAKLENNNDLKRKVNMEKIDCEDNEDIAQKENIEGFPTIRLYGDNNRVIDYEGSRTEESIIDFVEKNIE